MNLNKLKTERISDEMKLAEFILNTNVSNQIMVCEDYDQLDIYLTIGNISINYDLRSIYIFYDYLESSFKLKTKFERLFIYNDIQFFIRNGSFQISEPTFNIQLPDNVMVKDIVADFYHFYNLKN